MISATSDTRKISGDSHRNVSLICNNGVNRPRRVAKPFHRIQEIAVLASNMLFDEKSKERSTANLELALKEYQAAIKLTPEELNALPGYIKLAHGMHVLRAGYEKMAENNSSEENESWLNQGRVGLSDA